MCPGWRFGITFWLCLAFNNVDLSTRLLKLSITMQGEIAIIASRKSAQCTKVFDEFLRTKASHGHFSMSTNVTNCFNK